MLWIDLAGAVLGIGLIFFIINRALRFIKNNRRAFINLGLGLFLALLFFLAWYFDQKNQTSEALLAYLFYIAASIAHGFIGFASIMFPKLAYLKQRTTSKVYYQEYLYVLLRTEEQIFLFKKAKHLGGFVYKLKKTDYHDDVLKTLCTKWGVKTSIIF